MKKLTLCLLGAILCFAAPVHAALEYYQYTIADKTFQSVTEAPTDCKSALALNTSEKILFVRDTTVVDQTYYIAVFELTNAQAQKLGFKNITLNNDGNVAFGGFTNTTDCALPQPLLYPTEAEWKAYVDEKPTRPCNVRMGPDAFTASAYYPSTWYSDYLLNGKYGFSAINTHGLYDTFGNVAECTIDGTTIKYQGWYAENTLNFSEITRDGIKTTFPEVESRAGVRPIYKAPADQTYTVDVWLDNEKQTTIQNCKPKDNISFTVTVGENRRLAEAVTIQPNTITLAQNEGEYSFTMPEENVTINFTSLPEAKIVVEGGSATPEVICAGEEFMLTADTSRTFSHWEGKGITDENKTANPLTLTLGTSDITVAGETITYTAVFDSKIKINVNGGKAEPESVEPRATFTITAEGNDWQSFTGWADGVGITYSNRTTSPLEITLNDSVLEGSILTYTANFTSQPRVLVYGGSVTADSEANVLGNGYYKPGTLLTLNAPTQAPNGYCFSHWEKSNGSAYENDTYTVGAIDTVETFTAIYKADENVAAAETIHVGVVAEDNLTTRTAFGYVANETTEEKTYDKNTIVYYGTKTPKSEYACLGLRDHSVDFDTITSETANAETNRQQNLILKRVHKEGQTLQPYYLGIHEVTVAQYYSLTTTDKELNETTLSNRYPNTESNVGTFYNQLNAVFKPRFTDPVTFQQPTKQQVENISFGPYNQSTGKGDYHIDENNQVVEHITGEMVNSEEDHAGLLESGSTTVDPYGFYDLFGNAAEVFTGTSGTWGGYFNMAFHYCNLEAETGVPSAPAAIRVAIKVPKRYTVTFTNLGENGAFPVLENQQITLQPQVAVGRQFKQWTVQYGDVTATYAAKDLPVVITITADTTVTADFTEALAPFEVEYEGCNGPAQAFPGTIIQLYTDKPNQSTLDEVTILPAEAGIFDPATGKLTFFSEITGSVTIKAGKQVTKQGFQIRLR